MSFHYLFTWIISDKESSVFPIIVSLYVMSLFLWPSLKCSFLFYFILFWESLFSFSLNKLTVISLSMRWKRERESEREKLLLSVEFFQTLLYTAKYLAKDLKGSLKTSEGPLFAVTFFSVHCTANFSKLKILHIYFLCPASLLPSGQHFSLWKNRHVYIVSKSVSWQKFLLVQFYNIHYLKNANILWPYNFTTGSESQTYLYICKVIYMFMCVRLCSAVLFELANDWKKPKRSYIGEYSLNHCIFIH